MTDFNQHFWDKLRTIVREEVKASVSEETADMRSDTTIIKQVQGSHGLLLRTMNASLGSLKNAVRSQS